MNSSGPGRFVLAALMVLWVLGFIAFAALHLRPTVFESYMGVVAFIYGVSLVIFRVDAAQMASRWSTNRLMFSSAPQYRPGYMAMIGVFMAVFGLGLASQGLRHL